MLHFVLLEFDEWTVEPTIKENIGNGPDETSLIQREQATQDEMTLELVKMVQVLKSNALTVEQILAKDDKVSTCSVNKIKVMETGQKLLETNLNRLSEESTRLKLFSSQTSKTTICVWLMLLLVCLLFFHFLFTPAENPCPSHVCSKFSTRNSKSRWRGLG